MRLILVRHGHSKHAGEQVIGGKIGCKGLTEQGIQQAEQLARHLKNQQVKRDVLLSTSVKRAHQTATIISAHLNQPIQINDALCELLPGDADGLTWEAYRQQYGEFEFADAPDRPFAPNAESWNQFVARVKTSLDNLYQAYKDRDVIVVTHAGFIVVSFLLLFEAPFLTAAPSSIRITPRSPNGTSPTPLGSSSALTTSTTSPNKIPDANGNPHRVQVMKRVSYNNHPSAKSNPTIF